MQKKSPDVIAYIPTSQPPIYVEITTPPSKASIAAHTMTNLTSDNCGTFPLLAKLETDNIYLYGINPYGYVLYQDGKGTYFDWPGLTPRRVVPTLNYLDFDNDGKKELAVLLYVGSGTEVAVMDLHILKIDGQENLKPEYVDFSLSWFDVDIWFSESISAIQSDDKKVIDVFFNKNCYTVYADGAESEAGPFTGISFGTIVFFEFDDDTIKTKIVLGLTYENWATPQFFGEVTAEIEFDGNNFSLKNYTLEIYEDYIE